MTIEYNNNNDNNSTSTSTTNYPPWFNITPALLGFDNPIEFARYMKSKYKDPSKSNSESNNNKKKKKSNKFQKRLNYEYKPLLIYKIFVEQHHRTIQACKENIVLIA